MNKIISYTLLLTALVLVSCNGNSKQGKTSKADSQQVELSADRAASAEDAPHDAPKQKPSAAMMKIFGDAIQAVAESGITKTAKQVGDIAPDFALNNALGEQVKLSDLLKDGPVVLTWYRGGWCPFCNQALSGLQEELPKFKAAGATLVALTPELPDHSVTMTEKHALEFQVLTDLNSRVAEEYGILYRMTDELIELKRESLKARNGDSGEVLPLTATYIIEQDGTISYAFLDADHRKRAIPSEITKALLKDMKYNEILDLVKQRRSIRAYKETKVAREDIEKIVTAATNAPSGANFQPWEFIVIDDEDLRNKVSEILLDGIGESKTSKGFASAPVFILLYGDTRVRPFGPPKMVGNDSWWDFTLNASLNNAL